MNHRPRLSALIVVSTLTLVACSSGGGGRAASNRPFAAYRQCLQQHGVTPLPSRAPAVARRGAPAPPAPPGGGGLGGPGRARPAAPGALPPRRALRVSAATTTSTRP